MLDLVVGKKHCCKDFRVEIFVIVVYNVTI